MTSVEKKEKTFLRFIPYTKEEKVSVAGLSSDSRILKARVEKSTEFWQRMRMFLRRLDRLEQTMTKLKIAGQPEELFSPADKLFVQKAEERFGSKDEDGVVRFAVGNITVAMMEMPELQATDLSTEGFMQV